MIIKINKATQHKYEMQKQMQHKIRYFLKSENKSSGISKKEKQNNNDDTK